MTKPLVAAFVLVVVVVVAYLAYGLMRPRVAPCETIFQQTSLKLGSSVNLVRSKGPEVSIEEQKIQDLTERAQMSALNLKTCCIVLEGGKLDSEQFLRCKTDAEQFGAQVEKVATNVDQARAAKEQGKTEVVQDRLRAIDHELAAATTTSEQLKRRVAELQPAGSPPRPAAQPVAGSAPPSGAPQATPTAAHGGTAVFTAKDGTQTPVDVDTLNPLIRLETGQSIPYEKIKTIDFVSSTADGSKLRITVLDGRVVDGAVKGDILFWGKNDLGDFQVYASKLERIELRR